MFLGTRGVCWSCPNEMKLPLEVKPKAYYVFFMGIIRIVLHISKK
jgi:hypothetical protein